MGEQQPWQVLTSLPAWQVSEIPRPGGEKAGADWGAEERVAALVSAYGCDTPIAVAWIRNRPGGPVRVLMAGSALAAGTDSGSAVLTLPAGARGEPLRDGEAAQALAALPCWAWIGGVNDVLLADARDQQHGNQGAAPSLERGLLSAWLDAFGWLLLAEPVGQDVVTEMAADAAHAQLEAEQNRSPRNRLAARRASARHDELREAGTSGLWRVHLLAGAAAPDAAARVARLVAASADLRGLPYGLTPQPVTGSLPDTLTAASGNGSLPVPRQAQRPVMTPVPAAGRSAWDTPMSAGPWGSPAPAGDRRQWPQPEPALSLPETYRKADDERDTLRPDSPFCASTRLVAVLARPPARELPGLRFTLRPEFDVTPETALTAGDGGGVMAGTVLDQNRVPAGTIALPLTSLNRHVFVTGATGSGKSQTVRGLLEQATAAGIPWLVVEPAKAEYRLMAARLPQTEVIRVRPGDLDAPPAGINPLEPAPGPAGTRFPLQTHADLLRTLFLAAFQADEPFPQILSAALTRCYEQAGWDLVTGQAAAPGVQPAYPGLEDLQAAALAVVGEAGYGREIRDNVRGFVTVRIGSLRLGTTGRFLDGGHPIDFGKLLDANVVLEIEDAGDDHDKAFLMGAVLIRLTEHLRLRHRHHAGHEPVQLRHLTVIEEAHRLLRQPPPGASIGPAAHAVEMFADLLAEIRAYGEGLVIAEQIPAKLIPDVIKNTAVKIVHRLPAADDRNSVGATMNLRPAQSEYLVTLRPGEAAVHADGMDYPVLARMPDGTSRETASTGPAPLDAVIGRRSITCGPGCRTTGCTLAEMRAAWRAGIIDPRITLWAELAVLAHLTGWSMYLPGDPLGSDLRAMPARLRDCALSHAVDQAVAARAPAFSTRLSPDTLAAHVTAAMRESLSTGTLLCDRDEPQYLAPPYRWAVIRDALSAAKGTSTGRHPASSDWERDYGQPIPGETCASQHVTVDRWYDRDQHDRDALTIIAWGSRTRTAIEQAVGTIRTDPMWDQQLTDMLDAVGSPRWPLNYLRHHAGIGN